MKKIVVISLVTLFTTGCCNLIRYDVQLPTVLLELRDASTGEDLFLNGTFKPDSVVISSTDYPDQYFTVDEQLERTRIRFGASHDEFIISIGQQISFGLDVQMTTTEHRCYTDRLISNVEVSPFPSQVTAIKNSNDWSVIVFVN